MGTFQTDAEPKQHLFGRYPEGNTGAEGDRISFQIRGTFRTDAEL